MELTTFERRVVVKFGSSSLTNPVTGQISPIKMENLTAQVAALCEAGWQVIVVSSGAVAAGVGRLGWDRETISMPEKQAAAAVGQGLLIDAYSRLLEPFGIVIGQVLLTKADIDDDNHRQRICDTIETLLAGGVVPIVNENDTVAVEEIRVGDNDTLASHVALLAHAQMLILLTDVQGIFTTDPRIDPAALLIPDVWDISEVVESAAGGSRSAVGTGGMQTKVSAAKIATAGGIDVVIAASTRPNVLQNACAGQPVGTWFHAGVMNGEPV